MIKVSFCLRRKPGMSEAEFHDYWLNKHGPLVKRHAGVLGIRRYVQVHKLDTPHNAGLGDPRNAPEPFDGIAEVWLDGLESLDANENNEEAQAAGRLLIEDEAKFIDLENSPIWLSEEHEIVSDGGS